MAMNPETVLPQRGAPDEIDKILYGLLPDLYKYCDTMRLRNKRTRQTARERLIKAINDMNDAGNTTGTGKV